MEHDKIVRDISYLYGLLHKRYTKYLRNYNRFINNGVRSNDLITFNENPLSYWYPGDDETGGSPTMNVLASAIKTKVSKMSQTKVRPFFNPVNGTFKTRQVVRNAQIFFDDYFTRENIYEKGMEAYRDAQIFDYGILWANDHSSKVEVVKPWEFYLDPAEYHFDKPTRCFLHFRNYPKHLIPKFKEEDRDKKCELVIYYDLKEKMKYTIVEKEFIEEKKINFENPPFAFVFYEKPIKGFTSISLIDNSLPIQRIIDLLNKKIHEAASLTPANFILIPEGNDIKASAFSNKIGNVYTYRPTAAGGQVSVVAPNFINGQYLETLNMYEQKLYNMEGVSQLSAQSKKPTGINSGVALQTVDDIESERFQTELQQVINMYMTITQRIIECFDDDANLLPKRYGRANIKWKDLKKEKDLFNIQFSASSSLSKDPKVKMEQIEKLISMKLINPSVATTLLEMPDLEEGYSIMSASYDDCQKIIERAVNEDRYDFYEVVNLEQLLSEIGTTILRLDAVDEDPKVIERLVKLFQAVKLKIDQITPPPMPPVPPVPPMPVDPNMQAPVQNPPLPVGPAPIM